jgi:hypothetical protein
MKAGNGILNQVVVPHREAGEKSFSLTQACAADYKGGNRDCCVVDPE